MSIVLNNGSVLYPHILLAATAAFNKTVTSIMPQGGCGKARKISDDTIIDSDHGVVDNHGTKELPVAPEKNFVSDGELSDDSLPATVSIDKLQDAPGQHGVKRKISALVPMSRKNYLCPESVGSPNQTNLWLFVGVEM